MLVTPYSIKVKNSNNELIDLESYRGKVLLIVNVASNCLFSKQYKNLEELNQKYKSKGLKILAFPSNDHGQQEPGNIKDIIDSCVSRFNVSFDIFQKTHTTGPAIHPLFSWLVEQSENKQGIKWNFEKFIISRDGKLVGRFDSHIKPSNAKVIILIERLLAEMEDRDD